ncbi:PBECR4 domain-containing protein [Streptococcus ovuberis]|uniref:DUF3991 domain-containing protein n=1 Tax=Streptococcus ovuberis TaxID=1936207 RepID=A0A7X6MZY7_9STRE|nr:PBECR4 domain-containing protein [Streptococcus ovuberis]NKZ19687.1 DUF3991 domain-containing protein [Streptococcus ovuberis]
MATIEELKRLSILDVAQQLGLDMKRLGHDNYTWSDHDSFILNTSKNIFSWFSRDLHGDVIKLVQVIKEEQTGQKLSFKQAKHYLETGEFESFEPTEYIPPVFEYYLQNFESQDLTLAKDYLVNERGLSEDTINLFIKQGLLAQATHKTGEVLEPVIVFKTLDKSGQITGASLQGIMENNTIHERGRLKRIMRASDGMSGMTLDIGQPKRLVFAESPIDLMSYVELHRDSLNDVRLVAMDGLKEATISRHFMEWYANQEGKTYTVDYKETPKLLAHVAQHTSYFKKEDNQVLITLALDNDEAGRNFISKLQGKGIPVVVDLPPLADGQEKTDWNDYLKTQGASQVRDNSRLAQAYRKLERLENELGQATQAVFSYQAQTNGQPMNDKRGAGAFFKRRDQLENKAISLTREIEAQKERIERLEDQEENKRLGLNKNGYGLNLTVDNISRIKDEIEKFYRGESLYTQTTIRKYEKRLVELEALAEKSQGISMSPGVQHLIDQGLVNQWKKQPMIYFVKGLKKVAFELTDQGTFEPSKKYGPLTDSDRARVNELLGLMKNKEESDMDLDQVEQPEVEIDLKALINEKIIQEGDYYLWHDYELERLGASQEMIEEFHNNLEDLAYSKDGVNLYIEDSSNKGATGYLSLEGNVLNQESILTYLSENDLNGEQAIQFLDNLAQGVEETWSRVERHYDQVFENIVAKYGLGKEKSLEKTQGIIAETNVEDLPGDQEAAPLPEANLSQPLNDLSPNQTESQPLLHFTIDGLTPSTYKKGYHPVSDKDLRKLNRYAQNLQQVAQFYLNELADTTITYFYSDGVENGQVSIEFGKEYFMHLTGILPQKEGQTAEQTLLDFANGRGHFDNLLIANYDAAFEKLQVLPELQEIIVSDAFYFNDLSDIEKLHRLDLDKAIRTSDKDLLLALRTVDGLAIPASVMRLKSNLNAQLDASNHEKIILGVYRNRDGKIQQLSINNEYIKDGGSEMMAIMQNNQFEREEISQVEELELSGAEEKEGVTFEVNKVKVTSVLDTLREVGRPVLETNLNPDYLAELAFVDQLLDQYGGDLDLVITDLTLQGLVDTEAEFYQNWVEDKVYQVHQVSWADVANGKHTQEEFSDLATKTLDDLVSRLEDFETSSSSQEVEEAIVITPEKVSELIAAGDKKGLNDLMKAGIRTYLESDRYKEFLSAMAKLPHYSPNNLFLLQAQKADVSKVASFKVWKEQFGRLVNKGEKALRIWAPVTVTKKDKETGQPILDENQKPVTYTSFKLVPVFDISQTSGREFPKAVNNLEGTYDDYANLYRATKVLAQERGIKVELSNNLGNYNGVYLPNEDKIIIKTGMSETQTLKTFFHEMAHADLHNLQEREKHQYTKPEKELQAESVAFVVASHFGIDTQDYSFAYLANWSRDKKSLSDLEAQLDVIQKSAKGLIQRLDNILEHQQNKSVGQDIFSQRLAEKTTNRETQALVKEETPDIKKSQEQEENRHM